MAQMVKNLPTVQVTSGLIPGVEKFSEAGHSTHSIILAFRICMDRGAWPATVHGVPKSQTRLSNLVCTHTLHLLSIKKGTLFYQEYNEVGV